ncbi:MAG: carboxypeptidase-like regulatory domain-containing protein, partial [Bacteroidaceae bacterium]|nr:carboxypeptidase-like regulatory domain-containing protein [Bacteroidaceae bacterium]
MNKAILILPIATLLMLLCPAKVLAQKFSITGKVTERNTGEALPGATAMLLNAADREAVTGASTGSDGTFTLAPKRGGKYILRISYMGFRTYTRDLTLKHGSGKTELGTIAMEEDAKMMKETSVVARQALVEMKADTFVYNADAYRLPEGAVLEELVKKLPGAEVSEDGTITINGKTVKKIMVDGKEFFANDTKLSMKNLPTKMVQKIKAYDRQSDYSRVTGIDDGEEETVLDLTVKKGMKNGWLIDMDGGYGTKDRYTAKANVMKIQDNMQVAVMASSNNTNDRNRGNGIVSSQMAGANVAWENGKRDREAGLLKTGGSVRFFRTFSENVTKRNSETFLQGTSGTWDNSLST